jgi:hypothetical protein
VEEASIDDIPNALRNWEALAPEERWWLYTMTVATTGQARGRVLQLSDPDHLAAWHERAFSKPSQQ